MLIVCVCKHPTQTRGALAEWLKELSLFDHLLHGLFKFLNESSKGPTELKGKGKRTIKNSVFFMLYILFLQ